MNVRNLICALIVLMGSSSGGNLAHALSLDGTCSNWRVGTLTDSSGKNREAEAKSICTNLGKSPGVITVFDPRNQTCLLCSLDDWTPASSSSSATPSDGDGPSEEEEKVASGGTISGKPKCHLRTGYLFSTKKDTEFNVLKERNPQKNDYYWHYFTVATPSKRFKHRIPKARKEAQRIIAEGNQGRQYDFALRGSLDDFCKYLKNECDIENSVLKSVGKGCGWSQ